MKVTLPDAPVVLLQLGATWCGPCKRAMPVAKKTCSDLGIPFVYVNVDDNEGMADAYGIYSVPTFIIFKDGKEVEKWTGMQADLTDRLSKHITPPESH